MEPIGQMTGILDLDGQFANIEEKAAQELEKTTSSAAVQPVSVQSESTGDRVSISQEAKDAYTAASASSAPSGESVDRANSADASAVVVAYTNSGHKVSVFIETYQNEYGNDAKRAMVRLDGNDGQSRILALEDSMVITEDDSGNLVGFGATKDGVLSGTSGNDVIISFGASVYAGDGDDAIVVMRDYDLFRYHNQGITVDAGNGDDTLTADSLFNSDINMGDGNDTLTANTVNHHRDAAIEMGKGNDTVHINRLYGRVSLGEGNDVLVVGLSGGEIDAGDGDDLLNLGDFSEGTILAGAGNDVINAKSMGAVDGLQRKVRMPSYLGYSPRVTVNGGSGTAEINVQEDVKEAFIHGGSGNTTINARNIISSFFHNIKANISGEITSSLMGSTVSLLSGQEETYKISDLNLIKKMYEFAENKGLEDYLPTNLKI